MILSAVDIAQLAHTVDECILCREGNDALFQNDFGEYLLSNALINEALTQSFSHGDCDNNSNGISALL